MSAPQLIPNLMTGNTGAAAQGLQAMGIPPVGNTSGSQLPGPTGVNAMAAPTSGAMPALNPPAGITGAPGQIPGTVNPVGATPPVAGVPIVNQGVGGAIPVSQQQASQHQLTNVFGAGVGGDISSTINNLGSTDSTYMQAYQAAMAQPNAENLATLNTTLGNSGVGANSSTAAIANADFQTGVTSQEGLQEQQLQQTDEQNLIGLLTSTEAAANKQASTSVVGDIGDTLTTIAGMF
jgi:hypothetical protein